MRKQPKKLIAVLAAAVTAALILAIIQAKEPLLEKWYLWKYERQEEGAGKVELLGGLMRVHSSRGFVLLVGRLNEYLDFLLQPAVGHPQFDEMDRYQVYIDIFVRSHPDDMARATLISMNGPDSRAVEKFLGQLHRLYGTDEIPMNRMSLVSMYGEAQSQGLRMRPAEFIGE